MELKGKAMDTTQLGNKEAQVKIALEGDYEVVLQFIAAVNAKTDFVIE